MNIMVVKTIDNYNDKLYKEKDIDHYNALLKFLKCPIRLLMFLDSEVTGLDIGQNMTDKIALTEDGEICIIEVETNHPGDYAIDKEIQYGIAVWKNFEKIKKNIAKINPKIEVKKCIIKLMIVLEPKKEIRKIIRNPNCQEEQYVIDVYSPKYIDGEKVIKNINNKIENNSEILLEDYEALESLIHTKYSCKKSEILKVANEILDKLECNEDEKGRLRLIFEQQCVTHVKNEKERNEILELINMENKGFMEEITDNLREQVIEEVIEQGIKEGENKFIKSMKKAGASEELINKTIEINNKL